VRARSLSFAGGERLSLMGGGAASSSLSSSIAAGATIRLLLALQNEKKLLTMSFSSCGQLEILTSSLDDQNRCRRLYQRLDVRRASGQGVDSSNQGAVE
jgi:hypothetical protein